MAKRSLQVPAQKQWQTITIIAIIGKCNDTFGAGKISKRLLISLSLSLLLNGNSFPLSLFWSVCRSLRKAAANLHRAQKMDRFPSFLWEVWAPISNSPHKIAPPLPPKNGPQFKRRRPKRRGRQICHCLLRSQISERIVLAKAKGGRQLGSEGIWFLVLYQFENWLVPELSQRKRAAQFLGSLSLSLALICLKFAPKATKT